jgi:hypothetical protein
MVLLQNVHHSIDYIKVFALGIVDGVVVNHSIMIHCGVGLGSFFPVYERAEEQCGCDSEAMALRIGYSYPNSGGLFPANQGLREHSLRNSPVENRNAKV